MTEQNTHKITALFTKGVTSELGRNTLGLYPSYFKAECDLQRMIDVFEKEGGFDFRIEKINK